MDAILKWIILIFPLMAFALEGHLQGRAGYFYFASSTARKIYHTGTPDLEVEGPMAINRRLSSWFNLNYVWRSGQSEALHETTHLKMGTASFGPKVCLPVPYSSLKFYLGIGLSAAYLHIRDSSSYLPKVVPRWSVGVVGKSGWLIDCSDHFLLDLFFDYYYQPMRTSPPLAQKHVDLGGFRTGAGLAYRF